MTPPKTEITGYTTSQGGAADKSHSTAVRAYNIEIARAVSDLIRSTFGPTGNKKLLIDDDGDTVVTGHGAIILQNAAFEEPIATLLAEIAETLQEECGAGSTKTIVLISELLDNAEKLSKDGIHPTTIVKGYRRALREIHRELHILDRDLDEDLLKDVISTRVNGVLMGNNQEILVSLLVDAVSRVSNSQSTFKESINIVPRIEKWIGASELVDGALIEKSPIVDSMPIRYADGRVLLINNSIELNKPANAKIAIHDWCSYHNVLTNERKQTRDYVDAILELDIDAIFCQKGIDDHLAEMLASEGVLATRYTAKSDIELLGRALNISPIPAIEEADANSLSRANIMFDKEAETFHVTPTKGEGNLVTLLLRGSTKTVSAEIDRAIMSAIQGAELVHDDDHVLPGGGALEIEMASRLLHTASTTSGRQQLAIEAVSDALTTVPITLAKNAGMSPIDAVVELRTAHHNGKDGAGIDLETRTVQDMWKCGWVRPITEVERTMNAAIEVATRLIQIDDAYLARGG